jgi:hypothetical protein
VPGDLPEDPRIIHKKQRRGPHETVTSFGPEDRCMSRCFLAEPPGARKVSDGTTELSGGGVEDLCCCLPFSCVLSFANGRSFLRLGWATSPVAA